MPITAIRAKETNDKLMELNPELADLFASIFKCVDDLKATLATVVLESVDEQELEN